MSLPFYKVIHLLGIFMVLMALSGLLVHLINGGDKASNAWRKPLSIVHGVGMFLVLLGGFGMLARLGIISTWPGWVIAKLVIWIVMGGMMTVMYRQASASKLLWGVVLVLATAAGYLALYKPF